MSSHSYEMVQARITMGSIFATYCDLSDVEITDKLAIAYGFGDDWVKCCNYIDSHKELQELYQALTYQHKLYLTDGLLPKVAFQELARG